MKEKDWDKALDKASAKNQSKINRVGSIYTKKDKSANFKTNRVKRNFVGKDLFVRQKGRGFINTTTNFQVRWTPTKLILIAGIVVIPYIGLIILTYKLGLTIISAVLIVVMAILLGVSWFVHWMDKNF